MKEREDEGSIGLVVSVECAAGVGSAGDRGEGVEGETRRKAEVAGLELAVTCDAREWRRGTSPMGAASETSSDENIQLP